MSSSRPPIRTGDPWPDEALELQTQLNHAMTDTLDDSDLPTVVAFLWPWLDHAALSSATRRFGQLVGAPDDQTDATEAPSLVQLILAHVQVTGDFGSFIDDVVKLLVESIDGEMTRDILCALDKR